MCSSSYATAAWRKNLINGLDPSLLIDDSTDYRRFLPAHLQFLTQLCQLSETAVRDSINQFLSSQLIGAELLPKMTFESTIDSLIYQTRSSAPLTFARLLYLLRATNHGNAIVSAYGTNFKFVVPTTDSLWGEYRAN